MSSSATRQHFIDVLNEVRVKKSWSQRQLCEALGITIGTLTKYLRGAVEPTRVGGVILQRLAACRGVTTDSLLNYLESGEFHERLTIDDVASWIRSEAGQADLPMLLDALSDSSRSQKRPVVEERSLSYSFSDDEAEEFASYIRSAMTELQSERSSREIWRHIEEDFSAMPLQPEEIDMMHDLCMGTIEMTGELLTSKVIQLSDRFPGSCPLVASLQKLDTSHEIKALDSATSFCTSHYQKVTAA